MGRQPRKKGRPIGWLPVHTQVVPERFDRRQKTGPRAPRRQAPRKIAGCGAARAADKQLSEGTRDGSHLLKED